jgi:hypothetical protein
MELKRLIESEFKAAKAASATGLFLQATLVKREATANSLLGRYLQLMDMHYLKQKGWY